jgi:predicted O-methyltransferase YrrM
MVDNCLKIKLHQEFLTKRKAWRKILNNDQTEIKILDAGAGSKKLGSARKISKIFRTSSTQGKYSDLLYKISQFYQPNNVLELGTSLGYGTFHLVSGNIESKVISVEACPNTASYARKLLTLNNLNNVSIVNSTFIDFLNDYEGPAFDLVFVDGHHDGEALLNYMHLLNKFTHDETIFLLDDIRWSSSMLNAWEKLINQTEYHVSVDLFRIGILVKRKHQNKEHFIISY